MSNDAISDICGAAVIVAFFAMITLIAVFS